MQAGVGCDWQLPDVGYDILVALTHRGEQVKGVLRQFVKQRVAQQESHGSLIRATARKLEAFERRGGAVIPLVELESAEGHKPFACDHCCRGFKNKAGLAAHLANSHGIRAELAHIDGSVCAVCRVEHWSTPRLVEHVRHSKLCRAVYAGADLDLPRSFERVGKRDDRAWHPPGEQFWTKPCLGYTATGRC